MYWRHRKTFWTLLSTSTNRNWRFFCSALVQKKNQLDDIEYVIGLQLVSFNPSLSSSKVLCVRAWHHWETTCTQLIHSPWWWNQCQRTPVDFEEVHCKPIWTYIFLLYNYVCEFLLCDESLQHLPSGCREFPWDPTEYNELWIRVRSACNKTAISSISYNTMIRPFASHSLTKENQYVFSIPLDFVHLVLDWILQPYFIIHKNL